MRVTGAYLFGLAAVALGLGPTAAPAQNGAKAGPLEGTWEVVKLQIKGRDLTEALKDGAPTMTFKGDAYVFTGGPEAEKGTFKLDAKARPAAIDLKILESATGKGKTQLGIYELDGDTLRLCMADEGAKERPTKFASAEDAPEFLLATLKRKKAEK